MVIIDGYRKSWALRYIREAKDELKMSQKDSDSTDLIVDAARKAQAAIYYSLGEPSSIEGIVNETTNAANGASFVEDPILRCLVGIERTLKRMESQQVSSSAEALVEADEIVQIASQIVDLLTSGD